MTYLVLLTGICLGAFGALFLRSAIERYREGKKAREAAAAYMLQLDKDVERVANRIRRQLEERAKEPKP